MNTFHTDYVYRVMEHRRSRAMATPMTPEGRLFYVFWRNYVTALVVTVSLALAWWSK